MIQQLNTKGRGDGWNETFAIITIQRINYPAHASAKIAIGCRLAGRENLQEVR